MWAGMTVFWGLLIWGIYALISSSRHTRGDERRDASRRILGERLARGEISPEEYRQLLEVLSSDRPSTPVSTGKAS